MPKGPTGQRRPGDVVGAAINVAKIATGEVEEDIPKAHARKGGLKGGAVRAQRLTPEQRHEIAQRAAQARWQTDSKNQAH